MSMLCFTRLLPPCSGHVALCTARHRSLPLNVRCMARIWRPFIDDVDRLSRGEGARQRGTGCTVIPHRLNNDERPVYESAKKKGFLAVRGTGFRRGRKGWPINNSFRQWCDGKEWPCCVIEQDLTGNGNDVIVVDLATLRQLDTTEALETCCRIASELGVQQLASDSRPPESVPFNVIPLPMPTLEELRAGQQQAVAASQKRQPARPSSSGNESAAELQQQVDDQAGLVRELKASGLSNQDSQVQAQVQVLLKLKSRLQQLQEWEQEQQQPGQAASSSSSGGSSSSSSAQEDGAADGSSTSSTSGRLIADETHPFCKAAIWQIAPQPLFFAAQRSVAKDFAKAVVRALGPPNSLRI